MQAFHNDPKIQRKYISRVMAHQKADEVVQGIYWQNGKGCAVGCTMELSTDVHQAMEDQLGVPKELAYLEDVIFEGLTNDKAKHFPLKFLKAIPLGADLSLVVSKFMIWQFEDEVDGLRNIPEIKEDKELMRVCEMAVDLYKQKIAGNPPTEKQWEEAYQEADKIYWAGAGAGAYNENPYWNKMADKLIELLKESK